MSHVPLSGATRPVGGESPGAGAARRRPRSLAAGVTFVAAWLGGLSSGRSWARMDMRGRMGGMMTADGSGLEPRTLALFVLVAALLATAVWLGRTCPRAAYLGILGLTVGYLLLNGPVPAALVAPAFGLATLVRRRPQGEWAGWAALLLPTFAARVALDPAGFVDDPLPTLGLVFFAVAWVVLPATMVLLSSSRRAALAAHREDELRRVAYEERLRVARDIHDVVGHSLSMISLQSGVALHVLDSDPAQVRASLEAIRDASKGSLAELRTTLGVFRQPDEGQPLLPTPSLAGVGALVDSVRAGGRTVGLVLPPGASDAVPAAVQTVAYRVVQEGLTNVVRHAGGASAVVAVERRLGGLTVSVRDDGPASRTPVEGNGLRGMRERVEALGGTLAIGVRPGGGLAVEAVLPVGHE